MLNNLKKYGLPCLILMMVACTSKPIVIGIQPIGEVSRLYCDSVKLAMQQVYNVEIVLLPEIRVPEHTFVNVKSPRYRANKLIEHLREIQPGHVTYTIGLIAKDISTTKKDKNGKVKEPKAKYEDWGIFGLGYRPGASCIVSTYRINSQNKKLLYPRLKKIAVHEIGHNLGLPHCSDKHCVMQDAAETIATIDNVEMRLCDKCRRSIEKTR